MQRQGKQNQAQRLFLQLKLNGGYLNPARGDKGPGAADLRGDRTKDTASGTLLQFPEGFSSPPHIHNITYRGVVISGELHNDDPKAENMWLPAGSFWRQPAGEAHITAANGKVRTTANIFKVIVIEGALSYKYNQGTKELEPGSYFGCSGDFNHGVSIKQEQESVLCIRSNGKYEVLSK